MKAVRTDADLDFRIRYVCIVHIVFGPLAVAADVVGVFLSAACDIAALLWYLPFTNNAKDDKPVRLQHSKWLLIKDDVRDPDLHAEDLYLL